MQEYINMCDVQVGCKSFVNSSWILSRETVENFVELFLQE